MYFRIDIDGQTYELEYWYQPQEPHKRSGHPNGWREGTMEDWEIGQVFYVRDRKYSCMSKKDMDGFLAKYEDEILWEMRKAYRKDWEEHELTSELAKKGE